MKTYLNPHEQTERQAMVLAAQEGRLSEWLYGKAYDQPPPTRPLGFQVVRYGFAVMVDSSTPRPEELLPTIERQLGFLFRKEDFDVVLVNKRAL